MKLEGFLMSLVLFAFMAFLFPTFVTAIDAISPSEPLQPFLIWFPHLLLGASLILPVYFLFQKGE